MGEVEGTVSMGSGRGVRCRLCVRVCIIVRLWWRYPALCLRLRCMSVWYGMGLVCSTLVSSLQGTK